MPIVFREEQLRKKRYPRYRVRITIQSSDTSSRTYAYDCPFIFIAKHYIREARRELYFDEKLVKATIYDRKKGEI